MEISWEQIALVFAAALRFMESVAVVLKSKKALSAIEILKEFFRFG